MARILIIEDERDLQKVLEYNLRQEGHDVVVTGTGTEGLRLLKIQPTDLVILDLMLPDLSGFEVCKRIRKELSTKGLPVLMLTAKGEEIDRVVGFEAGADDYVVKPFSVRELLLRVQSLLRRAGGQTSHGQSEFGVMRMDKAAHRVSVNSKVVDLTALEFKLLMTLFDRKDRVLSRDVLLNDVWGMMADVTTRTVDTHIKRLREKLGPAGHYIETIRSVGYRFVAEPAQSGK